MQYHNAHHDPYYPDFDQHVFYFGSNAYCAGCFITNLFIALIPALIAVQYNLEIGSSINDLSLLGSSAILLGLALVGPYLHAVEEVAKIFRIVVLSVSMLIIFYFPPEVILPLEWVIVGIFATIIPQFSIHLYKIGKKKDFVHKTTKSLLRFSFLTSFVLIMQLIHYHWILFVLVFAATLGGFLSLWGISKGLVEKLPKQETSLSDGQLPELPRLSSLACVGPLNACTKGGGRGGCCGCNIQPCVAFVGVAIILIIVLTFVVFGVGPGRP